ncbi:preprotein translocase subunit SecD/SecD/SecF fusion protein [Candidatus Pelagibacter ubique]|uniref:Protein translocase subunit SecD n=1 Tax=Pelagibacter ubique TaxID=198252 RepID=A0ABX1T1Q4_PELUQ|nr:protein translocase subunit SecD [Candidatus Pelagibacter ubique]NMN68033.1 preprotein translocase subunit SecD/SecD/SecF fusion protein [Candidatus Pelagibacter ubique]
MLYFSKLRIVLVFLVSLFFIFIASSNLQNSEDSFISKKINLGLDLQGGSYLLLEIDNGPVKTQKLQNTTTLIRNFFKNKKIKFNDLRIVDNKIIFIVAKNNQELVKEFFLDKESEINPYYNQYKSHQFDLSIEDDKFTLVLSKYGLIEIKTSSQDQAIEIVRRRVDEVGTNEPNILKRGNNRILVELPGLDDPMRIKSLLGKTANLTFRFVTQNNNDTFGTEMLSFEDGATEVMVSKRIILNGENLLDAQPQMNNQTNETVVSFTLDRVGAKRFGKATSAGIGKQLAIVLDGKIVSAPVIRDTIASGNGQISGNFTFQSATDLALLLRSGALPAPLSIIEERTVGPDLGKDSIKAGVIALMIGFLLVIFFMLIKYKIFGLIANVTLLVNLFFLIGILTLFEATLTLPGIAGIILTVGMAVDANVLIFERIKEECKKEKNNIIAFDSGYVKSKTAIIDANITTLIAAIILFFMGSGPIKGFSVTLGVGIFTTLFSVYFIARMFTGLYVVKNKEKDKLI